LPKLLNPFDICDPLKHFAFELDGTVRGLTDEGISTIAVCGLDRPSLVLARQRHLAILAPCAADVLRGTDETNFTILENRAEHDLSLQAEWNKPFAAAVRSVFRIGENSR
jgi:hypothetical protein